MDKYYRFKNRFLLKTLILCCFFSLKNTLNAQFVVNGTATQTDTRCWTLTRNALNQAGSVWNETKINLNESFDISVDVFLGCSDGGADGMVFGLQPLSTSIGGAGGGMGFSGVTPSVGVEFDTWQNGDFGDPVFDHIVIYKNGQPNHNVAANILSPAQPFVRPNSATPVNIEDCAWHDLRVSWNARTQKLEIFWDCVSITSYTGDVVNQVFNGNPNVYWGFTASTGGASNEQKICLKQASFLDAIPDTTICIGNNIQLKASGGTSYLWQPATGLDNPTSATPIASPSVTTRYIVRVTDNCNRQFFDTVEVKVSTTPPFTYDIGQDTNLCAGQTLLLAAQVPEARFVWQDGSTDSTFLVTDVGTYTVKTTKGGCTTTDSIKIRYIAPPSVSLGNDTAMCLGRKLRLEVPRTENGVYKWQDGSQKSFIIAETPALYAVTVTNECGTASDNKKVDFENCERIYFPTAFTPNDDSVNDVFFPYSGDNVTKIVVLRIYNRWGNLVFEKRDFKPNTPADGWYGTKEPIDTYIWYAEVLFKTGETRILKGDIELIR